MLPSTTFPKRLLSALERVGLNAQEVEDWWDEQRHADEGPVAFLSRVGVLREGAERSLALMEKGYLALDPAHLIAPTAAERVRRGHSRTRTEVVAVERFEVAPDARAAEAPGGAERTNRIGTRIGKHLVVRALGGGGCGQVFQALHGKLGVPVAVKVLNRNAHATALDGLRTEAGLLAQLNHPNVVRVFDFEDETDEPHVVLELIDGGSLAELIELCGGLQMGRAVSIVADAARGLAAAHRAGVTHRDVKPGNILVTRDGVAKVTDFGLAEVAGRAPGHGPLAGTPAYMAPELYSGHPADMRSDQYALGLTLFEAATGHRPFAATTALELMLQHAEQPVPAAHAVRPELPVELSEVIARMTAKNPAARFASYAEVLDSLARLARFAPNPADHPTWQNKGYALTA